MHGTPRHTAPTSDPTGKLKHPRSSSFPLIRGPAASIHGWRFLRPVPSTRLRPCSRPPGLDPGSSWNGRMADASSQSHLRPCHDLRLKVDRLALTCGAQIPLILDPIHKVQLTDCTYISNPNPNQKYR